MGRNHEDLSHDLNEMNVIGTSDEPFDNLKRILDDFGVENIFTPLDGTALFGMLCKINHSCAPNVQVKYSFTREYGLVAYLVALRDIRPDEELLQSYIDQNMGESLHSLMMISNTFLKKIRTSIPTDTATRQAALADYGFTCTCTKCRGT